MAGRMMTRRGFFGAVSGAFVAALAGPRLAPPVFATTRHDWISETTWGEPITYKGLPFVYDPECPPGRVYLVNVQTVHRRKLGVIHSIT